MPRRIEIELTSARPDGTWTWRVAGAREPRGVLDGSLLPAGAKTGSVLKADAEVELEGYTILAVATTRDKAEKSGLLDLIESEKPFEAVTQQLAKRDRGDRGERGERADRGGRGERRDRPPRREGGDADRRPRREGEPSRAPRPTGDRPGSDRPGGVRAGGDRTGGTPRPDRGAHHERRSRPNFTAPPELPQRPKPKRLKPGRAHRNAVLAHLPEEQRPVADRALQGGIPAVRQAVNEQNIRLKAEGKPEVPAAGLLAMAEQLLPMLRVAEWLDRADAAKADIAELDLRDLRSVVAAGEDPMVARDESTRAVAAELKAALITKQESELALWFEDIAAAIGVGRVIRALKLSSQPPKAGIRFPTELAAKLAGATTANLTAEALADRWIAVLEAAAFSPVRAQIQPTAKPTQVNDELLATVKRVGPLLPQVAALFEIAVNEGAPAPKPLRPTRPTAPKKPAKSAPPRPPKPPPVVKESLPAPEELLIAEQVETPAAEAPAAETPAVEQAVVEAPAAEEGVAEAPAVEQAVVEAPPAEEAVAEAPAVEQAVVEAPPAEEAAVEPEPQTAVTDVAEPAAGVEDASTSVEAEVSNEPAAENLTTHEVQAPAADAPAEA